MVQSFDDARRRRARGNAGRVPPHNLQAEESLLGAMLLSKDAISAAVEICSVDDFYKPAHSHVFEAIVALFGQGEPADPVTVAEELRRADLLDAIGGPSLLTDLQANTPAVSNAARYARIVEEHALLRRLIGVAGEIGEIGYAMPDDVEAALDQAEAMVFEVAQRRVADTLVPLNELLRASLDHLEKLYERNEAITGTPTGYTGLDELLSGLQPSALNVVGARPGAGKTAFALGIAAHAAMEARKPVLLFSLEMSHHEVTQRLLSAEARVDSTRLRNGRLLESDWHKISHAIGRLSESPLYIDDNPNITVMEIRAKARRMTSRLGELGVVIIDYLQLMTGRKSAENRQVEVSEISRGLKILARELQTPVVALSQLSRGLEMRADKRPVLADLRESGCMPADTRLLRADTGTEITLGELVLSQQQPAVWSLDHRWRLVPAQLTRAFPTGIRPVFRLRLASGRTVDATANHRFRTITGWSPLEHLTRGDVVAVPRRLPQPLRVEQGWSDDELVLLAHLLGGGSIGPEGVRYATAEPANEEAVAGAAQRLFGIQVAGRLHGPTRLLRFPSPYPLTHGRHHPVRNWLEPHGLWGARSATTFIPESVFGVDDRRLALFLRHLWATDGCTSSSVRRGRPTNRIHHASTSPQLARGVQRALLRFGIRSSIVPARKAGYADNYHVRIQGADTQRCFLATVGCHGAPGGRAAEAISARREGKANPDVDLVPRRVAGTASAPLSDAATSDVVWDEVTEVVPLGQQPTFDATVDVTHNFVANGIVAHNSIEQDADVVMFIYRDELYNPESPDRGTAEIIVAKHRNGPTGVSQLAFLDRYTRFANMARV